MAASLRLSGRVFNQLSKTQIVGNARNYSSKATGSAGKFQRIILGGVGLAGACGAYAAYYKLRDHSLAELFPSIVAHAAFGLGGGTSEPQPSVVSGTREHALYLWIHTKPSADANACAKVVANLQSHIDAVCPPDLRDESDEVIGGVGFGPSFYNSIGGKPKKDFKYPARKGPIGELPASSGDIFIHAKSNNVSKLFELSQRILAQLPAGSVSSFSDLYGFVYRNGRDLSGFIDGTENPADDDDRFKVAVEKQTGGSYVITQKWIHKMNVIAKEKDSTLEGWIGRDREDSTELQKKPITSHVARMTGGNAFEQKKKFEIVRQSQPYGNLHDHAGLFFIGYAESPDNFEYMLDRMVGQRDDNHSDDVFRVTSCVAGSYWYFPSVKELNKLK